MGREALPVLPPPLGGSREPSVGSDSTGLDSWEELDERPPRAPALSSVGRLEDSRIRGRPVDAAKEGVRGAPPPAPDPGMLVGCPLLANRSILGTNPESVLLVVELRAE